MYIKLGTLHFELENSLSIKNNDIYTSNELIDKRWYSNVMTLQKMSRYVYTLVDYFNINI